jgi:hypothetical protein
MTTCYLYCNSFFILVYCISYCKLYCDGRESRMYQCDKTDVFNPFEGKREVPRPIMILRLAPTEDA